VQLKVADD